MRNNSSWHHYRLPEKPLFPTPIVSLLAGYLAFTLIFAISGAAADTSAQKSRRVTGSTMPNTQIIIKNGAATSTALPECTAGEKRECSGCEDGSIGYQKCDELDLIWSDCACIPMAGKVQICKPPLSPGDPPSSRCLIVHDYGDGREQNPAYFEQIQFASQAARALLDPSTRVVLAQSRADEYLRSDHDFEDDYTPEVPDYDTPVEVDPDTLPEAAYLSSYLQIAKLRTVQLLRGPVVDPVLNLRTTIPPALVDDPERQYSQPLFLPNDSVWILFLQPGGDAQDISDIAPLADTYLKSLFTAGKLRSSNWFRLYFDLAAFPVNYPGLSLPPPERAPGDSPGVSPPPIPTPTPLPQGLVSDMAAIISALNISPNNVASLPESSLLTAEGKLLRDEIIIDSGASTPEPTPTEFPIFGW